MFDYFHHGLISPTDTKGSIAKPVIQKTIKSKIEECGKAVGRVFCLYESSGWLSGEKRVTSCTGVVVSPNTILTAQHAVQSSTRDDRTNAIFVLKACYFCPRSSAEKDIILPQLSNPDVAFELQPLEKWVDTVESFKIQMEWGEIKWRTPNDFAFLRLKDTTKVLPRYALPRLPRNKRTSPCFVIGYPVAIDFTKFRQGYVPMLDECEAKRVFKKITTQMVSFEKKILSVAYSFEYNTQGFIRHTCPTLKGTSGGMFMSFEELSTCEHPCFIGIHVGGTEGMSNNYCVPVLRPEFALEYKKHILCNEEFLKVNEEHLKPFLAYHKVTLEEHFGTESVSDPIE